MPTVYLIAFQTRYPSSQTAGQAANQAADQTDSQAAAPAQTPASLTNAIAIPGSQQCETFPAVIDGVQSVLETTEPAGDPTLLPGLANTLAFNDMPAHIDTPFVSLDPSPFISCNEDSAGQIQANLGITNALRILTNMPSSSPFMLQEGSMLQELEDTQTPDNTLVEEHNQDNNLMEEHNQDTFTILPDQDPITALASQDSNVTYPAPTKE